MTAPGLLSLNSQPAGAKTASTLFDAAGSAPQTPSPVEQLPGVPQLDAYLSGGIHPEGVTTMLAPVTRDLSRATDSLRGPLGGLVPRGNGSQAPGPAAASATAELRKGTTAALTTARTTATGVVDRARKLFGVGNG